MENTVVVQVLKYRGKYNNSYTWAPKPKKEEKVLRTSIVKGN